MSINSLIAIKIKNINPFQALKFPLIPISFSLFLVKNLHFIQKFVS